MNAKLRLLKSMFVCFVVFFSMNISAQINYTENFDSDEGGWTLDGFGTTTVVPCSGAGALRVNLYDGWVSGYYGEMMSPSIGTSVGTPLTVTFDYKVLEYDSTMPTIPTPNSEEWGYVEVYYATSPTGPWVLADSFDYNDHVESSSCATHTSVVPAPAGATIYLGIAAVLENYESDFFVYIDNVAATQDALTPCTGTPAASAAVTSNTTVCDTQEFTLSLTPAYLFSGLEIQWQSSADGTNFTDVATGGTDLTYTTTQGASTWYRAVVSCSAGGDDVNSTPVQVISSGLPCYCDIEFAEDIEPITLVNFAGINNTTSAAVNGTPGAENFTSLTPGEVTQGETYEITVKGNTAGNYETHITVYIDFNHNGDLSDEGEEFQIGIIANSSGTDDVEITGNITIPEDAMTGLTYMRVLKLFGEYADDPCSSEIGVGYGQAEDYLLNVEAMEGPATLDYYTLQWPATMTIPNIDENYMVYAQAYEAGVTEPAGQGAGITVWVGYSTENTDPSTWTNWIAATYNTDGPANNNDEYMASLDIDLEPGVYYYATRFQYDGGPYTYGGFGGAWGETNVSGVLTVLCDTEAPEAEETQTLCEAATVADLSAEGDVIVWYSAETGGTPLAETTVLADGAIYYAAQIPDGGCESIARTAVTAEINVVAPVTVENDTQVICNDGEIDDLEAESEGEIVWYASATGGTPLTEDTELESGVTYYAAQVIDGCESMTRTAVAVEINVTPAPTGEPVQQFTGNDPVELPITELEVEIEEGAVLTWYATEEDAEEGENPLSEEYMIGESGTFYATQTIDGCESEPFAVTVDILLGTGGFEAGSFSYHPNPVKDVLTLSYTRNIDTVEVYNLVGQQVLAKTIALSEARLDLSSLAAGTYMVKVTAGNTSKTIKVIKQ